LKFGNFSEITGFFELSKISQKKFIKKFGNNFLFFGSKNPVFGSKSSEKVWKSLETGFSEQLEFSEFNSELSKNYKK